MADLTRFDTALTERVVLAIESGTAPWVRPWSPEECADVMPRNAQTGRIYSGQNVLWLLTAGFDDCRFLGYQQARKLGGSVRKGERGTSIIVMNSRTVTDEESGEEQVRRWLGVRTIFNVTQCDGLESLAPASPWQSLFDLSEHHSIAMRIAGRMGVPVRNGGQKAFYSHGKDTIGMPPVQAFESIAAYDHVLLHELAHATAHESRFARSTADTNREELIAEMAAMFVGVALGIGHSPINSERYCAEWAAGLRDQVQAARAAGAAAARIADYLIRLAKEDDDA